MRICLILILTSVADAFNNTVGFEPKIDGWLAVLFVLGFAAAIFQDIKEAIDG